MKTKMFAFILIIISISECWSDTLKGYAKVNGVNVYYEVHGEGAPLLLLHGAFMTIEGPMRQIADYFSSSRKVILVEFQGHGRTADIQRDITCENLADDMAELLKHLGIPKTDVLGYSLGAGVALQLAIRHPNQIEKVISISSGISDAGMQPVFKPLVPTIKPEMFEGSIFKKQYDSLSPHPKKFATLVEKMKKLDMTPYDWEVSYSKIKHPIFLVFGDSDGTTLQHANMMFTKLGGNVMGDLSPMPKIRMAIFPYTSHVGVLSRIEWLVPMATEFLAHN